MEKLSKYLTNQQSLINTINSYAIGEVDTAASSIRDFYMLGWPNQRKFLSILEDKILSSKDPIVIELACREFILYALKNSYDCGSWASIKAIDNTFAKMEKKPAFSGLDVLIKFAKEDEAFKDITFPETKPIKFIEQQEKLENENPKEKSNTPAEAKKKNKNKSAEQSKTAPIENPTAVSAQMISQPHIVSGTTQAPVVGAANTHSNGFNINNFIRPKQQNSNPFYNGVANNFVANQAPPQPVAQYVHSDHCTCGHHSNKNTKGTSKKPTPADPRPGVSLEDKSKELNLKVNLEYSHMIKRRVNEDQINTLLRVFDAKWLKKRLAESNFPLPNGNLPLFLEVNPAIYAQYASLHAEYAFDFAFITKNEAGKTFLLLICTEPEFDPAVNEYCDVSFIFVF